MPISFMSWRKPLVERRLSRISVSLCWTRGWSTTCAAGIGASKSAVGSRQWAVGNGNRQEPASAGKAGGGFSALYPPPRRRLPTADCRLPIFLSRLYSVRPRPYVTFVVIDRDRSTMSPPEGHGFCFHRGRAAAMESAEPADLWSVGRGAARRCALVLAGGALDALDGFGDFHR